MRGCGEEENARIRVHCVSCRAQGPRCQTLRRWRVGDSENGIEEVAKRLEMKDGLARRAEDKSTMEVGGNVVYNSWIGMCMWFLSFDDVVTEF